MDIYVARQPIFDKKRRIFGYELLFRDGMSNFFPDIDGDTATSKLLSNSFFNTGIEKITGLKLAFINFTQDLLLKKIPLMLPCDKIVVEILEDVEPEDNVVSACSEMVKKGYSIALDDFLYEKKREPLVALANIIKFDFKSTPFSVIEQTMEKLAEYRVQYLAEKVETYEEFRKALKAGFNYFQGYFFSKPEVIKRKDISSSQINLLKIMAEFSKKDYTVQELETIIIRDVALAYKLLRHVNSAYFGIANNISSIKQAIVLLGEKEVRRFFSLMSMAKLADEKPDELIRASIVRARFCELTGELYGPEVNSSELFTLGLFSLIDAILDAPMKNLMENLPLSENIREVLTDQKGDLKDFLSLAVSYETGNWDGVEANARSLGLNNMDIPSRFLEAIKWADNLADL